MINTNVNANLKYYILAALFAAVTAVCSWISVPLPFTPVPVNLATLAVFIDIYGAGFDALFFFFRRKAHGAGDGGIENFYLLSQNKGAGFILSEERLLVEVLYCFK